MNPQPSAEALALAAKLNGHETHVHSQCVSNRYCGACKHDAATIDLYLQLPQRNAALLLARGVMNWYDGENIEDFDDKKPKKLFGQLRDALAAIKTKI